MKPSFLIAALCAAAVAAGAPVRQALAQDAKRGPMQSNASPSAGDGKDDIAFDVNKLFANTCGWCHPAGGRAAGKGPQLMGTSLSDSEIISRVKVGKVGQMPGYAGAFDEAQLKAIVAYIRQLKPEN
jgi:mono/diheme cytochrome c family protein